MRNIFKLVGNLVGFFLILITTVSLEEAQTNIGSWLNNFGFNNPPAWLTSKPMEAGMLVVGILIIAATLLSFFLNHRSALEPLPLFDALKHITTPRLRVPKLWWNNNQRVQQAFRDIEQRAVNGEITLWGRQQLPNSPPLIKIPKTHWHQYHIGYLFTSDEHGLCNIQSKNRAMDNHDSGSYDDLHIDQKSLRKFWRRRLWRFH